MKNMKKLLAVCFVALFAIGALSACGGGDKTPAGSGAATGSGNAAAPKHFIVATDTVFAPFEFDDENGNFVGIDLDLLAAIAEDQGFTYEIQRVGWDAAIAMCQAGQADGMIAGASITEDRKASGWIFSDGYYDDAQCMAVEPNSDIKGFADLKNKNVVVKNGSMSDTYATSIAEEYGFTVVRVEGDTDMYQQVMGGQAAACFNDTVVLKQNIKKGVALKIVEGTENTAAQYGFAIHDPAKQELIDLFNAGLANIKASGKYDEILAKYLG